MDIPIIFEVEGGHPREWVIRLDNNIYGLKDSDFDWFADINEVMEARVFVNSKVDPFIRYRE